jgi:uncharacterized protein YjbI with pentapeptide repeats
MADENHVALIRSGPDKWNKSRPLVADLWAADLREADLRRCYLIGADMAKVDLQAADLTEADLNTADLTEADLDSANLTDTKFAEANLTGAHLANVEATGANFTGANLAGANLTGANLSGANLRGANLTGANLSGAQLAGANMRGANLTDAKFVRAHMTATNLSGAVLIRSDLTTADLTDATAVDANLTDANLTEATLAGASLMNANLRGGNLANANVRRANLHGANLSDASLTNADVTGVDLGTANLRGSNLASADLTDADLTEVNLTDASLNGTDLTRARLGWTVLGGVDLRGVVGLTSVIHHGPSTVGVDTLYESRGHIPTTFLRGCGLADHVSAPFRDPHSDTPASADDSPVFSCFIAYGDADRTFAERLHDSLFADHRTSCWLADHPDSPVDHPASADVRLTEPADRALRMADVVLLVCSEAVLRGPRGAEWVDREISRALQREERLWRERRQSVNLLIPVDLDGHLFSPACTYHRGGDLRYRVAHQFASWNTDPENYSSALARLVLALRANRPSREPWAMAADSTR